jgi:hypothetical protein
MSKKKQRSQNIAWWDSMSNFGPVCNFITIITVVIYCCSKIPVFQIRLIKGLILAIDSIKIEFR